ncbi:MAG: hypothetical protein JNM22_05395 [Saprospiraceae bacterium]|nr:hypothetical protein [Saprospiraceae bacterium]
MSTSFGITYPLQRDGHSQQQRDLEARMPSYAPVEGRNVLELLYFWGQYANVVLHYDTKGVQRNWSAFFENSVPFRLAEIYQFDAEKWWTSYQGFRDKTTANSTDGLELLMGHLFGAFEQHQNWHRVLSADTSDVSQAVHNLTATNLRFILHEYIGVFHVLEQRFQLLALHDPGIFTSNSTIWQLGPDESEYKDAALNAKIGNRVTILPHLLPRLDRMAEILYKSQLAVKQAFPVKEADMEALIVRDGYHDPMIGLMLAFLELFRTVQQDFNRLTQRHLDYFYNQVLQIWAAEHVPDMTHLIFELAKNIPDKYSLPAETAFKDGKDSLQAEIIFNSIDELVLNRATVAQTRTLFMGQPQQAAGSDKCPPVVLPANVDIGKPYVLSPAQGDYPALGRGLQGTDTLGRMGFVITSPVLRMAEGKRMVTILFTFTNNHGLPSNVLHLIKARLTLKDKWLDVPLTNAIADENTITIKFTLTEDVKPIEALPDPKLNLYGGAEPLAEFLFEMKDPGFNDFYQRLKTNPLTEIKVNTNITGVKNQLILKNDEGALNGKKSFQPFGIAASNNFYVSHPDFNGKKITNLDFKFSMDQKARPADLYTTYRLYPTGFNKDNVLLDSWTAYDNFSKIDVEQTDLRLFPTSFTSVDDLSMLHVGTDIFFTEANAGVLLKIKGDPFLHDTYPLVLGKQSNAAKIFPNNRIGDAYYHQKGTSNYWQGSSLPGTTSVNSALYEVPFPEGGPYNPVFESFSINYDAEAFPTSFIQLLPFADSTETLVLGQQAPSSQEPVSLVPFISQEGQLLIGIRNAPPNGNLALLFQFSEYTGNPDLELPTIQWSVLIDGGAWRPLQKDVDYVDDTQGFVQSGIIRFELPGDISLNNSILPSGQCWLRASVEENSAAFDHLLGIHAQAVKTVFKPSPANDLKRLDTILEAGKLKKFVQETAAISKVEQPYPAFGGKSAEAPEAYYRRVSEHLRHKGRAVNLWDYEALVLQEFPQIYKVKCLNHTLGLRGMPADFEFLAGHVTLVVVPDVRQLKKSQRDQPKANQNLLKDIKLFLQERISPFVRLEVLNPRYETIDTNFKVQFSPFKDYAYYKELLTAEIKDFLSPWRTDPPADIQFGGEMFRSSIIRFVEERTYVDYLTDFTMNGNPDIKSVQALTARSVLAAGTPLMEPI